MDRAGRFHSGRWVGAEAALALIAAGVASRSVPAIVVTGLVALPLLVVCLGRLRGRPLTNWLGLGLGYAVRRRWSAAHDPGTGLLNLVDPTARLALADGEVGPIGVVVDDGGLVAVLDIGDPGALLGDGPADFPSARRLLADLAAPDAPTGSPSLTVQVLLQSRPAPGPAQGNGVPASSYRQLTGGAVPALLRTMVAVRVDAVAGSRPDELTPVLLGALRRVRKRLATAGVPARPLTTTALTGALSELAPHTPGLPVREGWSGLRLGPHHQAVYRPDKWPALAAELVPRLLAVPAATVTVALTARLSEPSAGTNDRPAGTGDRAAGPGGYAAPDELAIRLSAPDVRGLAAAQHALERLFTMAGGTAARADGGHLPGLLATLPLARPGTGAGSGPVTGQPTQPDTDSLALPTAGLMMGRNRHGQPVAVHLLRPDPTSAVLVGGGRAAATVVLRALALGAHVVVQTGRPESWDHLLRGVAGPADAVGLAAPGAPLALPPASGWAPQLVVVDVGPVGADPVPPAPWRTTLLVRDDVSTVDLDVLSRADLVVLQPLRPQEAELVGAVLGLGDGHAWLTRIREDMVGLVSRRTVRWAQLSATPVEQQVIGAVSRVLAG